MNATKTKHFVSLIDKGVWWWLIWCALLCTFSLTLRGVSHLVIKEPEYTSVFGAKRDNAFPPQFFSDIFAQGLCEYATALAFDTPINMDNLEMCF